MWINRLPGNVLQLEDIPFLPISLFKKYPVTTTPFKPEAVFESSGTTGSVSSKHYVKDTRFYDRTCEQAFRLFYGSPAEYCFLALLPSYLERGNSSLVHMVNNFMKASGHALNGFYLDDHRKLSETLQILESKGQPTILIGVTYALLDFAAAHGQPLRKTILIETGGMKGRREELVRDVVHGALKEAFDLPQIHSEYGMTELLSQGYAQADGRFRTPPWMVVGLRAEDDPRAVITHTDREVSGAINIVDLANLYSCSFIATDDIGRLRPDGLFEVLGRLDNSDVRGCSLLTV
jgi:non-ribosomal peptide synthetase component F